MALTKSRVRLSIVEYGPPIDLVRQLTEEAGIPATQARTSILRAATRAASVLRSKAPVLEISEIGVRAVDIAGMLRLGPQIELEIVPKFLRPGAGKPGWREDFFFLAELSRHGRLLPTERLVAASGAPRDLATLVGRSMVSMYRDNQPRPLRTYRRALVRDFEIEGEPEPLDLIRPEPEGYEQAVIRFDRRNSHNSTILGAFRALLPEVADPQLIAQIRRIADDLSPQEKPGQRLRHRVPNRSRGWQPLVELSQDVIRGLGMSYESGVAIAPGYLVDTWRVWEDFVTLACKLGFGSAIAKSKQPSTLGTRFRLEQGWRASVATVTPDVSLTLATPCLVDAKYKGSTSKGGVMRMGEADVYEALAFLTASDANVAILVYPQVSDLPPGDIPNITLFERIEIDGKKILGISIDVRGISAKGILRSFSRKLATGLADLI